MALPNYLRIIDIHVADEEEDIYAAIRHADVHHISFLLESLFTPAHPKGIIKANIYLTKSKQPKEITDIFAITDIYAHFDIDHFIALSANQQRLYFLNTIHAALSRGATVYGWDRDRLDACCAQIIAKKFKLQKLWRKPKASPNRKLRAHILLDISSTTKLWIVFSDPSGNQISRTMFSIMPSSAGPIEFILGDIKWIDNQTVRVRHSNHRDYWLLGVDGDIKFIYPRTESGDAQAEYQLGRMYLEGRYVLQARERAMNLIKSAAGKDYKHAIRFLKHKGLSLQP
jgi:hypothetical protein